ncbi:EF-hand domain-containing family member C2-like, partial [Diaphorina citri]|uniref:EF-hand domain-containing family member C2 n=1 Tax=Diaphorina citri TaxID=121845 RepID=A0A3Q0J475_DIACI
TNFATSLFRQRVGKTNFARSHRFEYFDGVNTLLPKEVDLAERRSKSRAGRCSTVTPKGDIVTVPSWIAYDKQILTFDAYFKDLIHSVQGYDHVVRKVKILFYLEDSTIKVVEPKVDNSGIAQGCLIGRQRIKIPESGAFYDVIDFNIGENDELNLVTKVDTFPPLSLPQGGVSPHLPGCLDETTVLNLAADMSSMLADPLNCGRSDVRYYTDKDLRIGDSINVGGRRVVLYDCDEFTRSYYKIKYDIDHQPIARPKTDYEMSEESLNAISKKLRQLPPYNGSGSGMIIGKRKLLKPNQSIRTINTDPEYYTYEDLYVGAHVEMDRFKFRITGCDEYTMKFMENSPHRFPKANIGLILDKLRTKLKDNYKTFVSQYMKQARLDPVDYSEFRSAIHKVLEGDSTDQEILHLARRYQMVEPRPEINREELRSLVQTNLRRKLFSDFSSLEDNFKKFDTTKCGEVKKREFLCVLKGTRLPLSKDLICAIEQSFAPNEDSTVKYTEFIKFLNYKKNPAPESVPINTEMYVQDNVRRYDLRKTSMENVRVDICEFIKALGMEEQFIRENS